MGIRISALRFRLCAIAIIFSILIGQTACASVQRVPALASTAGPDIPLPASSTNTPVIQEGEQPSNTVDLSNEDAVITFTAYEYERSVYEPLIAQFHDQNPSITVEFVPLPTFTGGTTQDYYRFLASAADTSLLLSARSAEAAFYFHDLQPLIDADSSFAPDDFWPDALTACQDEQGQVLGLPVDLFMSGVFYDEQAFLAAGLPIPQPGWTWDDFRNAITALALQDANGIRYGFADPTYVSIVSPVLASHFQKMDGDIDPQLLAGELQWYVDLAKQNVLHSIQGLAGDEANRLAGERWKALFQGNRPPAMWFGRLQEPIPGLAGVSEDNDPSTHLAITRFGFLPLPVDADNSNMKTTPIAAQCVAVSSGAKNPQAAWKWAKFLTEHHLLHDASQLSQRVIIPARLSVADESGFWTDLPAGLQPSVAYGLAHGRYKGLYTASEQAAYFALEQAAVEGKDLTQTLTAAQLELAAARSQVTPDPNPVVVATPESAGRAPVIRFYPGSADAQELQSLRSIVDRFNRENAEQFSLSLIDSYSPSENQGYFEGLANAFDCFVSQVDPAGAAVSGAVLDLMAFLDGESAAFRQDYDAALMNRSRYEGSVYTLPLVIQPAVIAYNADLLVSHGLSTPSNTWTLDDFVSQITTIAGSQKPDQTYGMLPESQAVNTSAMFLAGRNVQWLDISGNVPVARLDTPEMASGLTWLSELYRSGAIFESATGEGWWNSITGAIQSGKIAYWTVLAGQQNSLYFDEGQKPPFRIGVAPLPATTANVAFDASIERGFYISQQSSNASACWAWAKYLSEQPVSWYGVPARTSVAASPAWESSVGVESADVYRLVLARLQGMRMEGNWAIMVLPLNSWLSQAEIDVRNGGDARGVLAEAQRKADAYQTCLAQRDVSLLAEADLRIQVSDCARQADPSW